MNWAVYVILVIHVMDLGYSLAKDGEQKTGKYSFCATFIVTCIFMFLYYKAGLFG